MSTWGDVVVNDVVEGKPPLRVLWRVADVQPEGLASVKVTIQQVAHPQQMLERVVPAVDPVVIAVKAGDAFDYAVATVQVQLGGVEVAHKNDEGRWETPVTFEEQGSMRGHLYVFHHAKGLRDELTLGEMQQEHHALHSTGKPLPTDHVHTPDFRRPV